MGYTNIGSSGRIYDVSEGSRLEDAMNQQEQIFLGLERTTAKNKDIIRYAIIGVGSILLLVLLRFAVKKKK